MNKYMLHIGFLNLGKFTMSYHDLDLDLTMPNIELVRAIIIHNNVFQFYVPRSIPFLVILQKHRQTHTERDSDEYPIVAF